MNVYDNILVIGKVWPEPNSSAAGTRMMQLLSYFKSKKTKLTFACTANPSQFQVDLEALKINVAPIELNSDSFNDFILELNPSLVVFDRFMTEEQFGWRVMEHCPNALRVLNTEDMHFLRDARHKALKKGKSIDLSNQSEMHTPNTSREISAIYRSDVSLIISSVEMQLLTDTFQVPQHLLHYLPLFVERTTDELLGFEERSDFVFIGNFLHEPNADAVKYLKDKIWPLIRKGMPKAKINIFGAYPTQKVSQLNAPKDGFLIHGRAESAMTETMKARVSLAPIRFGAGIKGKLLEAMACGTPSVTTLIGAEGIQLNSEWNGAVVDSTESFAIEAVELHSNAQKWSKAQENGFALISEAFNSKNHLPELDAIIQGTFNTLSEHRSKDYTSTLMQQQTMMSSRYLSYWIMEKEKKS
ncbi:MAG: glycosyltransferase involved in cell wall biosynthesis [Salibacteraceae bacterium]|jgi:glycosyltransferase involved in cell wall biosynthesis